jgi:hypothetical protein
MCICLLLLIAIATCLTQVFEARAAVQKASLIPGWVTTAGGAREFDITSIKENRAAGSRAEESNIPLGPGDVKLLLMVCFLLELYHSFHI